MRAMRRRGDGAMGRGAEAISPPPHRPVAQSPSRPVGNQVALDGAGNIYLCGYVQHGGLETTPGAFQTEYRGGQTEGCVMKLNAAGTAILYTTYLGGSGWDGCRGIGVDADGSLANVVKINIR